MNKKKAAAWIVTGVAVSIAICVTKSAGPLWAFLFPLFLE